MPNDELPPNLKCRACGEQTRREIRCQHCQECPVCAGKGFLQSPVGVTPCYNCNPDGMEDTD